MSKSVPIPMSMLNGADGPHETRATEYRAEIMDLPSADVVALLRHLAYNHLSACDEDDIPACDDIAVAAGYANVAEFLEQNNVAGQKGKIFKTPKGLMYHVVISVYEDVREQV